MAVGDWGNNSYTWYWDPCDKWPIEYVGGSYSGVGWNKTSVSLNHWSLLHFYFNNYLLYQGLPKDVKWKIKRRPERMDSGLF